MNVIGRFGRFIIDYQDPILIGLILIVAAAVIFLAARLFINAKRKRELLSQINDAVSEINSAVSNFGEKKPEMIYIDNRVSQREEPAVQEAKAAQTPRPDAREPEEAVREPEEQETEETVREPKETSQTEAEETSAEIPVRYFSRDCSVSKNGVAYTREELNSQIRE